MSQQRQEQLPASEQQEPSFADHICQIVDAVQNIRGDEATVIGGQTLSEIIADGETPVTVLTVDVQRLVEGIRACLRSGLRARGRGILGPLITVTGPSFWPFVQSLTPQATQDYIHESSAQASLDAEDVEVLELAWLVAMINDGTLADYVRMIIDSPMSVRLKWYSKTGKSAILDEAPLKVLEETVLQVCDVYFSIQLADLYKAVHASVEKESAVLADEGLKAPPPSPVLAAPVAAMEQVFAEATVEGIQVPTEVTTEEALCKDTFGIKEELAPVSPEAQPDEGKTDKELQKADLDVKTQPVVFSRVQHSLSTLLRRHTEPIIDTTPPAEEAVLVAGKVESSAPMEPGNEGAPLHGAEAVEESKTEQPSQELATPEPTPEETRPSILDRMRQSFNALIGEPFMEKTEGLLSDTEQQSQNLEQKAPAEVSDAEQVLEMHERPRVSSRRSSILSELHGSLIDPLRNGSLIERLSRQGSVVSRHSMVQKPSSAEEQTPAATNVKRQSVNERNAEQQQ